MGNLEMTSHSAKAIFVLTVLALGTLQTTGKRSSIEIKNGVCPSVSHLVQISEAGITQIFPILSFLGDFYTLIDGDKHFKNAAKKEEFVSSFAEGRKDTKSKGKEVHYVLEKRGFSEEEVKKMTNTASHGLVHDMFINSKVSSVDIVNKITYQIAHYSEHSVLHCF